MIGKNDRDWHQTEHNKLDKAKERIKKLDEAVKSKDPRKIDEALKEYEENVGNGEK